MAGHVRRRARRGAACERAEGAGGVVSAIVGCLTDRVGEVLPRLPNPRKQLEAPVRCGAACRSGNEPTRGAARHNGNVRVERFNARSSAAAALLHARRDAACRARSTSVR